MKQLSAAGFLFFSAINLYGQDIAAPDTLSIKSGSLIQVNTVAAVIDPVTAE